MEELMLKIDKVSKKYKLGEIGGTTLKEELQRLGARIRHKEDPTKKIGAKNYNKGETFMALDNVSFEVKKGERFGIIGHNGAGKSTLLKLISRVTAPTEGTISMNGRIASMLEVGTGFHGELTGRENVYMNGAILGMTKKEIDSKMQDIIDFSEVAQFIDTPVKRYSSGMYVKLAFSVAAHLDSEIMIMDEVLAVGDMAFQKKCIDKMNQVSKEECRTILYVSHNMNTIRQLCDRVVVLDHGKVIFNGDVEEGIGIYMNVNINNSVVKEYYGVEKPGWLWNQNAKINKAFYVDKENILFKRNEIMRLSLSWKNLKDIDNMCFRFEVNKLDGSSIATAMIYDFYSGKKDNIETKVFDINLRNLTYGHYSTCYVYFFKDKFGNDVDLEWVEGLNFDICKEDNDIVWSHSHWGYIELPNIKAEKDNQK